MGAGGGGGETSFGRTSGGGGDNYRTQQSYTPEDEDSQSKWQRLDENEKKRVAAEAYKAFEKSLEDRRGTALVKPPAGSMGRGGAGRTGGGAAVKGGSGGSGATKRPATASAAEKKKQSSQVDLERKKHQDMVKAAANAAKGQKNAPPPVTKSAPLKKALQQQQQQQSAEQIRASAAQASAKRMSLAERAAKTDQDRKKREIRLKAEARRAQEAKQMENIQRAAEAKRKEEAKKNEVETKQKQEIRRAEELRRRAEADLALAAEAKAKADAIKATKQQKSRLSAEERNTKDDGTVEQMRQGRVEESKGSLDPTELIEAALLGAEEPKGGSSRTALPQGEQPKTSAKQLDKRLRKKKAKTLKTNSRSRTVAGSGFEVSKNYDVMVMKDPKGDIDVPQLLEGSLKDLLKKSPSMPKRNAGNNNY